MALFIAFINKKQDEAILLTESRGTFCAAKSIGG
jgi:hypothetical protein